MFRQLLNWRTLLALVAILIVSGTISYSSYLANKIEKEERQKVEQWVEASNLLLSPLNTGDTRLHLKIIQDNDDIPIIATDQNDKIFAYKNLDSIKSEQKDSVYLKEKLQQFKSENIPIIYIDPFDSTQSNKYYYGHSQLLREVQYYPIVQLVIVGLFILITVLTLRSTYRSTQNQVWAGMAKETAHQLGTPVSSLEGWMEILKDVPGNEKYLPELEKDVNRLRLVSDRFGKIGSTPILEPRNVIAQVEEMVEYVRRRASGKVIFSIDTHGHKNITLPLSAPLFDWVIENLLKNALDAMEGKGSIHIDMINSDENLIIDVVDTGKGISTQNISKVFKPGFTTKKRGWGLGLSLSKRIIDQYHKGSLTVKNSEPGKGTTFRIVLKK
jgi:signal transduction histidine kinase